jgi:hypothetical protein
VGGSLDVGATPQCVCKLRAAHNRCTRPDIQAPTQWRRIQPAAPLSDCPTQKTPPAPWKTAPLPNLSASRPEAQPNPTSTPTYTPRDSLGNSTIARPAAACYTPYLPSRLTLSLFHRIQSARFPPSISTPLDDRSLVQIGLLLGRQAALQRPDLVKVAPTPPLQHRNSLRTNHRIHNTLYLRLTLSLLCHRIQ